MDENDLKRMVDYLAGIYGSINVIRNIMLFWLIITAAVLTAAAFTVIKAAELILDNF